MQKIIVAVGILASTQLDTTQIQTIAPTQQEIPAYAKWGKIAIKETQSKYPNALIIDYLFEGSEAREDSTIENFRLWLKENNQEFAVSVKIEHTTETNELVDIQIQKASN